MTAYKLLTETRLAFLFPSLLLGLALILLLIVSPSIENDLILASILGAAALGLRHAFDADHIVSINNVVKKLHDSGSPSRLVGLFFSLGHSTIVFVSMMFIAMIGVRIWQTELAWLQDASTLFIIVFLTLIILINSYSLIRGVSAEGVLHKVFGRVLKLVRHQWQMYPVGFLFGLGLDTAIALAFVASSAPLSPLSQPEQVLLYAALALVFAGTMSFGDSLNTLVVNRVYSSEQESKVKHYQRGITIVIIAAATVVAVSLLAEFLGIAIGGIVTGYTEYLGVLLLTISVIIAITLFLRRRMSLKIR